MQRLNALVKHYPMLMDGDFFMRSTSEDGVNFSLDENGAQENKVVAWSCIGDGCEILCALNLNLAEYAVSYVTVDNHLHAIDSSVKCLFASDLSPSELNVETRNGKAVRLTIPPHALVIYS